MPRRILQPGLLFAVLLPLASASVQAAALTGSPPVVRHAPDVDVYPQNFAITQDADGIVYVGNTNGVLEFDGERWTLVSLPNGDIVRSLAADGGRVWVGGYNAFGWLERDAAGRLRYNDLSPRAAGALDGRELADVWQTVVAPECVYFRALLDTFCYEPDADRLVHWHHAGRFGALVHHQGRTLLQFRGEGMRVREGARWRPMPGTAGLRELVHTLLPLSDGGLLAVGSVPEWWRLDDETVSEVAMPEGTPPTAGFDEAMALPDGGIALAGSDGRLFIVDAERRGVRSVRVDNGFLSALHPAAGGGLLVSGDDAIFHVQWPAHWSVLGAEHGAQGSLYGIAEWDGAHYLASSAGVFRIDAPGAREPSFERQRWWDGLAYDLIALDARSALVAGSHRLFLASDGSARPVGDALAYPRSFRRSRHVPGRILVATENGLRHVDASGDAPVLLPQLHEAPGVRVSSMVELAADRIWIGSERDGAWRIDGDPGVRGGMGGDAGARLEARAFEEAQGLRFGPVRTAAVVLDRDGSLVVSTHAGLFRFDDEGDRFVATGLDGLEALRGEGELLRLATTADGARWAWGVARVLHQPAGGDWLEQPVRTLRRGAIDAMRVLSDGAVAFVTTQALLLSERPPALATAGRAAPQVSLRAVERVLPDGTRLALPLAPNSPIVLPQGGDGLSFRFALPELTLSGGAEYQGRLRGYEEVFSSWSRSRSYTYSRLSPGDYTLEVRGKDAAGRVSSTRPWPMVIEPPWHLRWWAMATWIALAACALWALAALVVRQRTLRLAAQTTRLEALVAERTAELERANRRLDAMAHVDGLTGIANRRSLDQQLGDAWDRAHAIQRSIAVLAIDVDHFKRFNDSHGHLAGDQLLRDLVRTLQACLRDDGDLLARYGGEEFVAVLPGADVRSAGAVAERMCARVREAVLGVTVSIGVASRVPRAGEALAALLHEADQAMYAAKRAGRDRVAVASGDADPVELEDV